MDYGVSDKIQEHLNHHEKLLWAGKPRGGILFRMSDWFTIPFSLLWCGFAIFWFVTALTSGAPFFFALFGIPFVIIGLVFVFGRFIIDAKQRENTIYGITGERLLIVTGLRTKAVKAIPLHQLFDINYTVKPDGSGTINFFDRDAESIDSKLNRKSISFNLIPEVKVVYDKIVTLQQNKFKAVSNNLSDS